MRTRTKRKLSKKEKSVHLRHGKVRTLRTSGVAVRLEGHYDALRAAARHRSAHRLVGAENVLRRHGMEGGNEHEKISGIERAERVKRERDRREQEEDMK